MEITIAHSFKIYSRCWLMQDLKLSRIELDIFAYLEIMTLMRQFLRRTEISGDSSEEHMDARSVISVTQDDVGGRKDLIEDTDEGAEREAQLSDQIADSEPKTSSLSLSLDVLGEIDEFISISEGAYDYRCIC